LESHSVQLKTGIWEHDGLLRGLKFYALLEDITEALNKDVDLIPEYQAEREQDLFEEIKCTGVKIYDRKR
jgi:hypothetical protein